MLSLVAPLHMQGQREVAPQSWPCRGEFQSITSRSSCCCALLTSFSSLLEWKVLESKDPGSQLCVSSVYTTQGLAHSRCLVNIWGMKDTLQIHINASPVPQSRAPHLCITPVRHICLTPVYVPHLCTTSVHTCVLHLCVTPGHHTCVPSSGWQVE